MKPHHLAIGLCSLFATVTLSAVPELPLVLPLWAQGAPGSETKKDQQQMELIEATPTPHRITYNIHNPSLTIHLPPAATATGAAVVIAPGGGHAYLSIDNEGNAVAQWLNEHGIAGFVLSYRLARDKAGKSTYTVEGDALADVHRAIRQVRSHAKEWGIDPARIGFLGFSAGGELAALAGTRFDEGNPEATDLVDRESSRPAFVAYGYPGGHAATAAVKAGMPPAFLFCANDDTHASDTIAALFPKYRAAGVSVEVHVFATGGHGFGMRDRPLPITGWPSVFRAWLADRGMLGAPKP